MLGYAVVIHDRHAHVSRKECRGAAAVMDFKALRVHHRLAAFIRDRQFHAGQIERFKRLVRHLIGILRNRDIFHLTHADIVEHHSAVRFCIVNFVCLVRRERPGIFALIRGYHVRVPFDRTDVHVRLGQVQLRQCLVRVDRFIDIHFRLNFRSQRYDRPL